MTEIRPDVVALIADCLTHPETELIFADIEDWRHGDGKAVTPEEVIVIKDATLGEMRAAVDIFGQMAGA